MKIFSSRPQPTFKFFYVGAIVIIASLGCIFSSSLIAGIILLIIGIFILLSVSGVIIDSNENRVKTYYNFLFLKIGEWKSLSQFTHIVLGPNSSSQAIGRTSTTFRTNSYSVSILDKTNKFTELQEFTDYKKALAYLELVSQESGLPAINKQEIIEQRAAKKRQYRK